MNKFLWFIRCKSLHQPDRALYRASLLSCWLSKRQQSGAGGTAVVRLDALGDYLLFRPCLPQLKAHYGSISYICSETVAPLVRALDGNVVDEIIPVNMAATDSLRYVKALLKALRGRQFARCLHPTWSRCFMSDVVAAGVGARQRVAWDGDTVNQPPRARRFTDRLYTELLTSATPYCFEFFRNKEFLSCLGLDTSSVTLATHYHSGEEHPLAGRPVYCLGASLAQHRLSVEKIADTADYLNGLCGTPVVLLGGQDVEELGQEIIARLGAGKAVNLAGHTPFPALATLLESAPVVISHDSFTAHMAALCGAPTVVLAHGSHYGRFFPYPEELAPQMTVIYPPEYPYLPYEDLAARFPREMYLPVSDIPLENITAAAHAVFSRGRSGTPLPRRWPA